MSVIAQFNLEVFFQLRTPLIFFFLFPKAAQFAAFIEMKIYLFCRDLVDENIVLYISIQLRFFSIISGIFSSFPFSNFLLES